jgi:hypothetical protein
MPNEPTAPHSVMGGRGANNGYAKRPRRRLSPSRPISVFHVDQPSTISKRYSRFWTATRNLCLGRSKRISCRANRDFSGLVVHCSPLFG